MKCSVYKKCNGCQLMNMDYPEQLRFKEIKCVRSLGKYGRVEKIVPMSNPYPSVGKPILCSSPSLVLVCMQSMTACVSESLLLR